VKLRKSVVIAIAITIIGAPIALSPVNAAKNFGFEDYSTDAALCKEIGMQPLTPSRSWRGWPTIEIPGVGTKTNFACGPSLYENKPLPPPDGTRVDISTEIGNTVLIPCGADESVDFLSGEQYAYIGLPGTDFETAPHRTWQDMKLVADAEARSRYLNGNVYFARQIGTFEIVGQWTKPGTGEVVKCNVNVTVSEKAKITPPKNPTSPKISKKCVKAEAALAKAKKASAPKQIKTAKKAVAKFCK